MKLISCIVFSVILTPLVIGVPLPQMQPQSQSQSQSQSQGATAQSIINAQSVNGGIAFTQQFMQLLSMLFNNFNSIVPRFVNLFTGQNQAAIPSPAQSIPSLSNIPGLPSLPSVQAGFQPPKYNNQPSLLNQPNLLQAITPRDTELINDNDSNDIINDAVDILSI